MFKNGKLVNLNFQISIVRYKANNIEMIIQFVDYLHWRFSKNELVPVFSNKINNIDSETD